MEGVTWEGAAEVVYRTRSLEGGGQDSGRSGYWRHHSRYGDFLSILNNDNYLITACVCRLGTAQLLQPGN